MMTVTTDGRVLTPRALWDAPAPVPGLKISLEFFPPRGAQAEARLWETVARLAAYAPDFVSVTYGAGGSTRDKTRDTVLRMRRDYGLAAAAHLTCVDASRADVMAVAEGYIADGIDHVVALRGDPPQGAGPYVPHPDGFPFAVDLVRALADLGRFEISVAAYPEVHPQAQSAGADLDNLKAKLDAGATRAITQYFFDPAVFLRFRDRAAAAGITRPILPGLMPVLGFQQIKRFSAACGAGIPDWMERLYDGADADEATHQAVSAMLLAEQARVLAAEGCADLHFYTLNKAELTISACHLLGIRPRAEVAAARAAG
ncbi:5,10-methylenetetrahydrofolate reductase [Tistrella mobilis KA081020-065]|uniref:Methylenetetrahydrofolate reductase n=2 Tax=Tistrella mobilis TaxID=171437 RepID=I3TIS6_TISMK|nr:5,10-methylenetetrahydrofolate reductase [Tistrella mobilis KA081020-065]